MPAINLSSESSHVIKRLVEQRGLVYQPLTLDSGQTPDLSIREPQKFFLSQSDLRGVDKSKPVILLAHGYTATTYEWDDLARYIDQNANGDVRYSQILLGGHGRSLEDFKNSNWQDWGKPILEEYQALVAKGFTNISLAGSSTACALILEQLNKGAYSKDVTPHNVFLIDPIVEPSGFMMRQVIRILAIFKRSYPPQQAFSPEEFSCWYGNRPFTTIHSLNDLTWRVQRALSAGIQLPRDTHLTVWASQGDPTVNPDGYKLIHEGVKPGSGGSVSVYPINSRFHVFTRLSGRPEATWEDRQFQERSNMTREAVLDWVAKAPIPVTTHDRQIQKKTFDQMLSTC
ncbi:MAG: hypothetical protein LLG04_04920 [Parachlamydia sp.]|nr:hypothetical protein [Parachlamydia sp.]